MTMVTIEPYAAKIQIDNCAFVTDYEIGTVIMEEFNELLTTIKMLDYKVETAKIENNSIGIMFAGNGNGFSINFKLRDEIVLQKIRVYGMIGDTIIDLEHKEINKKPNLFKILMTFIKEF